MRSQGFYTVQRVIKSQYKQGWRFLTQWEGYSGKELTWEPIGAFVLGDGRINDKFVDFCREHDLGHVLGTAKRLANKR